MLIPKVDRRQRPLGLPAARDRVAQAGASVVLGPIFAADFRASSYGPCPKRSARAALRRVGAILARLGLELHPAKTRVVDVRDGRQGFDFLGFHCRKVEPWRWRGKRYLQRWPNRRAMQATRARVKAITAPRHRLPEPVRGIVTELNLVARGWGAYFRMGNSSRHFDQVDRYVRERLGLFLSKKTGRAGRRWGAHSVEFFRALGVHQLSGTVAWAAATPRATR